MNIQIMKVYSESFHNVRSQKQEWLKLAVGPVFVWALGALILAIAYFAGGHPFEMHKVFIGESYVGLETERSTFLIFAHIFYNITYLISMISLYINGYRYAVLQEGADQLITLNLNMRFIKFALYTILVAIIAGIYIAISAGIIIGAHSLLGNIGVNIILGLLLGLYAFYIMFRIVLFPVLISIDHSEPIKTSWKLMKGNILRFLGLSILIMLTISLIGILGFIVLALLGMLFGLVNPFFGGGLALILGLLFTMFLVLFGWAVNSKMMGLIYQELSQK